METLQYETVGSIVANNWKISSVFNKHNIDFCCNGAISLSEACSKREIDINLLLQEIFDSVQTDSEPVQDYNSWSLNLLAEHIELKHHKYAAEKMPQILANLNKICSVHGVNHPELLEIRDLFREMAHELVIHMKREEFMIFPVIKKMVSARSQHRNIAFQTYGTIQNPIAVMMHEHENEGDRMHRIAVLSNGYLPAADACVTYRASFSMLKEFEDDLHKHIHLENNILFPKAVLLEKELQVAFN